MRGEGRHERAEHVARPERDVVVEEDEDRRTRPRDAGVARPAVGTDADDHLDLGVGDGRPDLRYEARHIAPPRPVGGGEDHRERGRRGHGGAPAAR